MDNYLVSTLYHICQGQSFSDELIRVNGLDPIIDRYPYIPYIPSDWNGFLVIAESQQLRARNKGNESFLEEYKAQSQEKLIHRLYQDESENGKRGITPWDDGHLKVALKACFPNIDIRHTGIANAVPWHLNKTNHQQNYFLVKQSVKYWISILCELDGKLKCIINTGTYARDIVRQSIKLSKVEIAKVYNLRSASQLHWQMKNFNQEECLKEYPLIRDSLKSLNIDESTAKKSILFYALLSLKTINNQ